MTLLWNTPRVWETNDALTKERLNAISDDLTYLMSPSYEVVTVRGTGTSVTTTSTTPVDLDPAVYTLNVELTGVRPVTIELSGHVSNGTLAAIMRLDVFIDGVTYASSLTATQVTGGLWDAYEYVAANLVPVKIRTVLPPGTLAAGIHTFVPRFWTSAGTMTWYELNQYSQFLVGEI